MRLTDEPRQLSQMKPDVPWPADLQAVMDKALSRAADKRYKSASEFAHDLVQAIDRMPVTSITAMGTEVLKRMSANSMAKAQTAATMQVDVPQTRVASKDEAGAPARSSAGRPPASPAVTPTKSKMPMMAAIAAVVIIAGGLGAWQMMGGSKPGPDGANSTQPAGTANPQSPPSTPVISLSDSLSAYVNVLDLADVDDSVTAKDVMSRLAKLPVSADNEMKVQVARIRYRATLMRGDMPGACAFLEDASQLPVSDSMKTKLQNDRKACR